MTTLLSYLRADLPGLMKRRETVTLRAVRDVVGAIENAEVTYLTEPYAEPVGSEFISGGTRFGFAERVVRELSEDEMLAIARTRADERLAEAGRLRALGRVDSALMLKAEALAITDRLDAFIAEREQRVG
ncbi:MAG: hypothetical protein J0I14_12490 [Propionibacteriaceae bacterium]|jgi:uncharacterized protein YqeY|nr:hypothetical protein [Propionibacteriaceae bacterium]